MNRTIVHNWNKVVSPKDRVYHLGDVTFKASARAKDIDELLGDLIGHKYLTPGNHDNLKSPHFAKHFDKIQLWFIFTNEFFCSHVPLNPREFRNTPVQVHGHTHKNNLGHPYINVSVEQTNYAPVHIEQIRAAIKEKV